MAELQSIRCERKYCLSADSHNDLENIILRHPALFKKTYPARQINNIYFDTPDFDAFADNIDGNSHREKIRIRWYGESFNVEIQPQFENKLRISQHNYKITKKLKNFKTKTFFNLIDFKKYIQNEKNNKNEINYYLNNLYPNLFVSYLRKYFIFDNVRITLDTDLKFINLAEINFFSKKNFLCINKKQIVELKYSDEFHYQAAKITKTFNNRLNKFSKYQIGILETFC